MDIKKRFFNSKFWAGLLLAQFLLFFVLSKITFAVNLFDGFYEWQKKAHQKLFALVPFSVGDVFYALLGMVIALFIFQLFSRNNRWNALPKILILLNIFYFVYQTLWGMLYFQKPLFYKLSQEEVKIEEAKNLALEYLEKCKKTRELVSEDKNGVFVLKNIESLKKEIILQQKNIPQTINSKKYSGIINLKPSIFEVVMSYSGISGYYNPFSAEAQYNSNLPSSQIPITLAHESAHQLGYAREQEASFIGYLMGINSNDIDVRYSTELFVLKSLLNSLFEQHPKFVENILANYSPSMKRDRIYEINFSEEHQGTLDAIFAFTNNIFLKSNQQDGSITYSYFVDLLIRYERQKKNHVSQRGSKNTNDEKKFTFSAN